eukprot:3213617-Rhodomonas_salina.1
MLSRFSCGLAVIGWLGICLLPLSLAIEEGALWTASELAGLTVLNLFALGLNANSFLVFAWAILSDMSGACVVFGLTAEATWLAGVAFTEDERSASMQ